jgi:hypothetical protein
MILKTYQPTHRHKFSLEQNRRFDIFMYIILTILVLAATIYTSL